MGFVDCAVRVGISCGVGADRSRLGDDRVHSFTSKSGEDVLPVGRRGVMGMSEQHHYRFAVLPTSDRDREAFWVQSANGQVVHFMKTCGNYFYGCQ